MEMWLRERREEAKTDRKKRVLTRVCPGYCHTLLVGDFATPQKELLKPTVCNVEWSDGNASPPDCLSPAASVCMLYIKSSCSGFVNITHTHTSTVPYFQTASLARETRSLGVTVVCIGFVLIPVTVSKQLSSFLNKAWYLIIIIHCYR